MSRGYHSSSKAAVSSRAHYGRMVCVRSVRCVRAPIITVAIPSSTLPLTVTPSCGPSIAPGTEYNSAIAKLPLGTHTVSIYGGGGNGANSLSAGGNGGGGAYAVIQVTTSLSGQFKISVGGPGQPTVFTAFNAMTDVPTFTVTAGAGEMGSEFTNGSGGVVVGANFACKAISGGDGTTAMGGSGAGPLGGAGGTSGGNGSPVGGGGGAGDPIHSIPPGVGAPGAAFIDCFLDVCA